MECIYVLELEKNKYYVGKSRWVKQRIKIHCEGLGSSWTKFFKPTGRYRIIKPNENPYNLQSVTEATVTYHLMLKLGHENVRGAGWTQHDLSCLPKPPADYGLL